jgi:hypothetical protein
MKMMIVVFRSSLEEEMLHLLKGLDVKALTEAPKVFGMGEAGTAFSSFAWPGFNSLILAALEEEQIRRVITGLQAFRDHRLAQQHGKKVPIRVFLLPCEQVI